MGAVPRRGGRESPAVVGYDGCLVHGLERHRRVVRGLSISDVIVLLSILFPPLTPSFTLIFILFVCFFGYPLVLLYTNRPSVLGLLPAMTQPSGDGRSPGLKPRFGLLAPN